MKEPNGKESLEMLDRFNNWCKAQNQQTFSELSMLKHDVESKPRDEKPSQIEIRRLGRIEGRLEVIREFQNMLHDELHDWGLRHDS